MPRKSVPSYCLHKASGQAYVKINGNRIYLGKHGTPESHKRYSDEIAKWQDSQLEETANITVGQLTLIYCKRCEKHYVKDGKMTSEMHNVRMALRPLNRLFRDTQADSFTPMMLSAVRKTMLEQGTYVRDTINRNVRQIVRMFKWAVSQGLVRVSTWQALCTLQALQKGRCDARESEPVQPVPLDRVEAVKPFIAPHFWAAIQFQLATACRPGEALRLRLGDIDRSGPVWIYRPGSHKTQHRGKGRIILIGPRGQDIIMEHAGTTDPDAFVFTSNTGPGKTCKPFRRDTYTTAIRRSCEKAFGMPQELRTLKRTAPAELRAEASAWRKEWCWHPHQLRHAAATAIRKAAGTIEVSKTILGHSEIRTAEIYTEKCLIEAAEVIAKIG